jgi:hypothetical protein
VISIIAIEDVSASTVTAISSIEKYISLSLTLVVIGYGTILLYKKQTASIVD